MNPLFDEDVKKVLSLRKKIERRNFLKGFLLSPLLSSALFASKSNTNTQTHSAFVSINGDLDDDLHIIKAAKRGFELECCHQMHNPSGMFLLEGRCFKNEHCPGYINYNATHSISNNEILIVTLSNEREEREPDKKLLDRTHYKSVPLYINNIEVFPSLIPEMNDVDYTTWYDPETPEGAYNYYRLWENAVVNLGIVVPQVGKYKIELVTSNEAISFSSNVTVLKDTVSNVIFTHSLKKSARHPFEEMDGGVFLHDNYKKPNDSLVRELAAHYIIVTNENNESIVSPLPYPLPYINRVYFLAC